MIARPDGCDERCPELATPKQQVDIGAILEEEFYS
jgi:hypothetical protein